jgi:glycerol-3-phosphate dehydrogenase (NAD(P)+)
MEKIAVIGAGGWGTALAIVLSPRHAVTLREKFPEYAQLLAASRENRDFLPGFAIPGPVRVTASLEEAMDGARCAVLAVPSPYFRETAASLKELVGDASAVIATKGLEAGTGKRMSEVFAEETARTSCAVLSGPTIAREIAAGKPAAAIIASADLGAARDLQSLLSSENLRLYASDDVAGVEIAGAVKNAVAIGAGIVDGLDLGDNAKASFLTRGIAESAGLGVRLGAREKTFWGLAGLGDLLTTSYSSYSRNHRYGQALARGKGGEFLKGTRMVVEGVFAVRALRSMGVSLGVDLPIVNAVFRIVHEGSNPWEELKALMGRRLKDE